jgi:uncharacterized protein (TIGR03437 family)
LLIYYQITQNLVGWVKEFGMKKRAVFVLFFLLSALSAFAQAQIAPTRSRRPLIRRTGEVIVLLNEKTFALCCIHNGERDAAPPVIAGAVSTHWLIKRVGPNAQKAGFDRVVVADVNRSFPGLTGTKNEATRALAAARKYFAPIAKTVEMNFTGIEPAQIQTGTFPNDPLVASQWHLGANGIGAMNYWAQSAQTGGLSAVSAPSLWTVDIGSGINLVPELAANVNVAYSRSFVDGLSPIDDPSTTGTMTPYPYGHDTMVAGVIGAVGNNGIGIAGIDWKAEIVSFRVFYPVSDGNGGTTLTTSYDLILQAFVAVLDLPVSHVVVNCSFSFPAVQGDQTMGLWQTAIGVLGDQGLVVAAVGNNGDTVPQYPAAFGSPNVVAVAATDSTGQLASFSSRGPWAEIAAPGVGILSTANDGTFQVGSGTSLAAPMGSGVAVLLWKASPSAKSSDIKQCLLNGSQYDPFLAGLLAAPRALSLQGSLAAMQQLPAGGTTVTPQVTIAAMTSLWTDQPGLSWGGAVTIWGSNFTGVTATAPADAPLPTRLGNVSVLIGQAGNPFGQYQVPLIYVGPGQINLVLPMSYWSLSPGSNFISVVQYDDQGNTLSGATMTDVVPVPFNPGFELRQDGTLYTEINGTRTVAYVAGLGFTDPALADGVTGTGSELVIANVQVLLDGQLVAAQAVASPAGIGLYEVSWLTPVSTAKNVTIQVGNGAGIWAQTFSLPQ